MSHVTNKERRARRQRLLRRLAAAVGVVLLGAAWVWQRTLPLAAVDVVGATYADAGAVIALTEAQPDSVALFSLSPALMADRAQRHPWVRTASVRRLPTGTLRVAVEEREPVALVLVDGEPDHFFDAEGYAMPIRAAAPVVVDVPLLTGQVPTAPDGEPVENRSLRELLRALADADDATDALVSEIDWQPGRLTLWTTPAGGHGAIPVRLGRTGYANQLTRLRAFWDQSVLPRPAALFRQVDLRFDGQVVTHEGDPPPPAGLPPDSTARSTPPALPHTPSPRSHD